LWLVEVAGYWRELLHTVVQNNTEHPKHVQWVTCLVGMQDMEELGHFQLPVIVYRSLRHGYVHYHVETRGDGIRISSCTFKLPLIKCNCVSCPFGFACPYHNPTNTMGHSVHAIHTLPSVESTLLQRASGH
jgi:hypothetical protein